METRQQQRQSLWKQAMKRVTEENLVTEVDRRSGRLTGRLFGMRRAERRKLAKAYFKGAWKEQANVVRA